MRETHRNSWTNPNPPCSCGSSAHPHPVAYRYTADGIPVAGWSNGDLHAAHDFVAHAFPIEDLHRLLGAVELYDYDELQDLILKARCGRI